MFSRSIGLGRALPLAACLILATFVPAARGWNSHSEITQAALDSLAKDEPLAGRLGASLHSLTDYCWNPDCKQGLQIGADKTYSFHRDETFVRVKKTSVNTWLTPVILPSLTRASTELHITAATDKDTWVQIFIGTTGRPAAVLESIDLLPVDPSGQLVSIESKGMLIPACTLSGETRADDVAPGNGACARASRNRWIIVYQTRSWRGVDDERSIVYQVRKDAPDGPVLKEGFLAQSINDWDPLGDGSKVVRQHGHPVIFGVPRGALIDGKPAPNGNLFVVKWRVIAIGYDPVLKKIHHDNTAALGQKTQGVQWTQIRLNDEENDIAVVQPTRAFRQKGFETGDAVCSAKAGFMNQAFVPAVPFNHACTEWADVNHFVDQGEIAPLKIAYNAAAGLYEFVETGPLTGGPKQHLMEASLARQAGRWIVAARSGGMSFAQTDDPFKNLPKLTAYTDINTNSPLTVYTCADGVVRIFTNDFKLSPYHGGRNPLYAWDVTVKPDGFAFGNRQVIFDTFKEGLKFRSEVQPRVDFGTVFPPVGKTQIVAYRVSPRAYNFPYETRKGIPAIDSDEKPLCGLYYSVLTYRAVQPEPWTFADGPAAVP